MTTREDKFHDECGVMGIFNDPATAQSIFLGLYALQHRGQEGCGIVTFDNSENTGTKIFAHKSFGLVADAMTKDHIARLKGNSGVGHVRYSTQGGKLVENLQPFQFKTALGPIALAHNGNVTNARELRKDLEERGSIFQSTSDSEVFIHLILRSDKKTLPDKIFDALHKTDGAYSLTILTKDKLYAVRDPYGFRPLVLGKKNAAWIVASESCALDLLDAAFVREINPGELLEISADGLQTFHNTVKKPAHFCSFEPIYFSRPDSRFADESIYAVRKKLGCELAREYPCPQADMVIAIPDSGVPMAVGYAEVSKLPYELGLVRNHYIGRTFIEPTQDIRDFGVKLKLNPVQSVLQNKKIVLIDDSLVRGTTSANIVRLLRQAGVREIHFLLGCPPITHSCFYGVDTPDRSHLLAAQKSTEDIRKMIGADSLGFLSLDGLKKAVGEASDKKYCYACFTGKYPENIHKEIIKQPTDGMKPALYSSVK